MAHRKRVWLVPYIVLTVGVLAGDGAAQPQPRLDLWQFPKVTSSKAFQRWWWAFRQRAYPLDDLPWGAQLRALQQIEASKVALPLEDNWVNIGPAPVWGGQIGASGQTRRMSGRVAALAVDPSNADHWLIGAAQGGVWETVDTGRTWTPKTDDQASLAM